MELRRTEIGSGSNAGNWMEVSQCLWRMETTTDFIPASMIGCYRSEISLNKSYTVLANLDVEHLGCGPQAHQLWHGQTRCRADSLQGVTRDILAVRLSAS